MASPELIAALRLIHRGIEDSYYGTQRWEEQALAFSVLKEELAGLEQAAMDANESAAHEHDLRQIANDQSLRASEALTYIADHACQIFPRPGPERDANGNFVWPSNCVTQLAERPDYKSEHVPCMTCRARDALEAERDY